MTRVRLMACPLLVASVAAAGCGRHDVVAAQAGPTPAAQPPSVEVTHVTARTLNSTLGLPGELTPYESVDLYARETGFVKSIRVDRGSKVKRGELLAELEAPELVARRAQANAAYQSAESQLVSGQAKFASDRATYERMREAAKVPGVVAGNDLDIAQKTAESGEANVASLQQTAQAAQEGLRAITQLESYLKITAPFDGQVTTRYVHPGALVGPSGGPGAMTPIVRIQTAGRHRLVVPVPQNDIAGVPEGTTVSFTVSSSPGRTFQAPIARISREVDVKTRTMPVELDVKDPRGELAPGTFCEVEWPIRRTYPTLFVPVSSIASNLQRTFVIRVRANRTEWVDVKTGARVGPAIEVFGELHEGDIVVTRGTDQIRPATEVRVKEVTPAS
jgi:membrane fusion protein, multidrug efflux system